MGYNMLINGDTYEKGNYIKLAIFENSVVTKPFSLVQRDFKLKDFFNANPNTGGMSNSGRVMDCICRIDAILRDKNDREYGLVTPIITTKRFYDINYDVPKNLMGRVDRWAKEANLGLPVGNLTWEDSYPTEREAQQKVYECVDVLLNRAGMSPEDLAIASYMVLADDTSTVTVVDPDSLQGTTFDLRQRSRPKIAVIYNQTGECVRTTISGLVGLYKAGRLTNVKINLRDYLVSVVRIKNKEDNADA